MAGRAGDTGPHLEVAAMRESILYALFSCVLTGVLILATPLSA